MSETRQIELDVTNPESLVNAFNVVFEQTAGLTEAIETLTTALGMMIAVTDKRRDMSLTDGLLSAIGGARAAGRETPVLQLLRIALEAGDQFPRPPNGGKRFRVVAGGRKAA